MGILSEVIATEALARSWDRGEARHRSELMTLYIKEHPADFRIALGAQQSDVFRQVVGQGMRIAAVGVGVGVLGAFAVSRFLQTLLFEVSPADPVTFVTVVVILSGAAFAACYLPARRAIRTSANMRRRSSTGSASSGR